MLSKVNKKHLPTILGGEYRLIPKRRGSGKSPAREKRGTLEKWTTGRQKLAVFRFPGWYRECFSVADFWTEWEVRRSG
jgi:hypothetical protein